MELWWAYLLVGFGCGVFSATFGVGSGIIMIPALVLIFSLPQKSAQGVCLAAMVPMALVGAIRYKLNPEIEVNFVIVGVLSVGAVVGAWIGSSIAGWASAGALRKFIAIIMIVVAVKMLLTSPAKPRASEVEQDKAAVHEASSAGDDEQGR